MEYFDKRNLIVEKLRLVIDPEIGMSIVDVGLIYGVEIAISDEVKINMTLTTSGCPMTDYFLSEIETVLLDLEFVQDVTIVFIWTPPWDITMMDGEAKMRVFES